MSDFFFIFSGACAALCGVLVQFRTILYTYNTSGLWWAVVLTVGWVSFDSFIAAVVTLK